jgi:hypothetical protein
VRVRGARVRERETSLQIPPHPGLRHPGLRLMPVLKHVPRQSPPHTHTHTHTCTHAHTHTRTHAHTHTRTHTHAHTGPARPHFCSPRQPLTRTHTRTRTCTHTHKQTHAHTRTHTHTHARTHTQGPRGHTSVRPDSRVGKLLGEFGAKGDWVSRTLLRHQMAVVIQVWDVWNVWNVWNA